MNLAPALAIVVVSALTLACQARPVERQAEPEPAAARATAVSPKAIDVWERSRQCADQADRVMKRIEAELRTNPDLRINLWENHYNAERERCYVRVSLLNSKADHELGIPAMFDQLIDAFENRTIAEGVEIEAGDKFAAFCTIRVDGVSSTGDCAKARAYINDRMSK